VNAILFSLNYQASNHSQSQKPIYPDVVGNISVVQKFGGLPNGNHFESFRTIRAHGREKPEKRMTEGTGHYHIVLASRD